MIRSSSFSPTSPGSATGLIYAAEPSLNAYVRANARALLPGIAFACVRSACLATCPLLLKQAVEVHLPAGDYGGLLRLSAFFVVVLSCYYWLTRAGGRHIGGAVAAMLLDLRGRIYHKLQFLAFGYLDQQRSGRLLSKYAFDTQKVEGALLNLLNSLVPSMATGLLVLLVLVVQDWRLGVLLLAFAPVYEYGRRRFFLPARQWQHKHHSIQETLTGTAAELIGALRLARSFGAEAESRRPLDERSSELAEAREELTAANQAFGAFTQVANQLLSLVVVAGGVALAIHGDVTLGTLFMFIAALPFITSPLQQIGAFAEQHAAGEKGYASIRELLDSRYVETWAGTRRPEPLRGEIRFEEVSFRYADAAPWAVQGINLLIPAGQNVAFVGASGSGKSTLANLILGLYSPQQGRVLIDGVPQSELDLRWLRRRSAIVMQDNLLLSGTLLDNIRFARPSATGEEVRAAARAANAEEFILALPDGYATLAGERGVSLSGGQRQRVSIARAFLRDPRLLILDEATSALDYQSEQQIQTALTRLVSGRTVITIAHRLATVRRADCIFVFQAGRVIESGPFTQLASPGTHFSRLLAAQQLTPDAA